MNAAVPSSIVVLQHELAPTPGRWRRSLFVAMGTAAALMISISLQVSSFAAPAIAFVALQPANVCTWRNLGWRVLLPLLTAVVVIPVAGVLVQLPWLLLPCLFASIALVVYVSPLTSRPLEGLALMFAIATAFYIGVFDPFAMPSATADIVYGYVIGIATATVFAQLLTPEQPSDRLAHALAAGLTAAGNRLRTALTYYCAEQFEARPGEASMSSSFGDHLKQLQLVRQQSLSATTLELFGALAVIVERLDTFVDTIDALSRQPVGRTYRHLLSDDLAPLLDALHRGLTAYAEAADRMGEADDGLATRTWPDFRALVAAVEARQLALRQGPAFTHMDVAEAANTNAFVQALFAIADMLLLSPHDLRALVAGNAPEAGGWGLGVLWPLNPYAARYAIQTGLATTFSYLIGIVAHTPQLLTIMWNPLLIAQSSYGATIRRSGTRFAGVIVGCLIALAMIIGIMPNVSELPALAIIMFVVIVLCQYVALGPSDWSYIGWQAGFSFIVVIVDLAPTVDVHGALWRAYGNLLGTLALFLTFRIVAPDYAGRQLIARFADLVRSTLAYLPPPGTPPIPMSRALAIRQEVGAAFADILRLADEARSEGRGSGVDAHAAIDAAGRAIRIASRTGLVTRSRATVSRAPLTAETAAALARVESALRDHLSCIVRMLDARHTMARPGSHGHRRACDLALAAAVAARPALADPLDALLQQLDAVRFTELHDWPPAASGALFAEAEHLRRIGELMPSLDEYLGRMMLPGSSPSSRGAVSAPGSSAGG